MSSHLYWGTLFLRNPGAMNIVRDIIMLSCTFIFTSKEASISMSNFRESGLSSTTLMIERMPEMMTSGSLNVAYDNVMSPYTMSE